MSGYIDRGETTGGSAEGYFDRQDMKGPEGVVPKDDIEFDDENPNIAKAVLPAESVGDETAGVTTRAEGTPLGVVEGSDSERTGTSWGLPAQEGTDLVTTPAGPMPEGEGNGEAHPNRNTADDSKPDNLEDKGAWKTMDTLG